MEHADLYELVRSLLKKQEKGEKEYREEAVYLEKVCGEERKQALCAVEELCRTVKKSF